MARAGRAEWARGTPVPRQFPGGTADAYRPHALMTDMTAGVLRARRLPTFRILRRVYRAYTQDPHAALGVRRGASLAEVKRRYRELAKLHHPDRNPADREGAEQRFKAVSHAYVQLLGCRVSGVDVDDDAPSYSPFTLGDAEQLFRELFRDNARSLTNLWRSDCHSRPALSDNTNSSHATLVAGAPRGATTRE